MSSTKNRLEIRTGEIRDIPQEDLEKIIKELKGDVLTLVHDAGSGHCGGSLSIINALFTYYLAVHNEGRQMHLSEGHCVPALYAMGHRFGDITDGEMAMFRRIGEVDISLSGHADKRVQPVPSGLLGQGPGVANGIARAERIKAKTNNGVQNSLEKKVYCFCGDGETDEGAVWEAFEAAVNSNLNVCYVINNNEKNLSGNLVNDFDRKAKAMRGFGIHIIVAYNHLNHIEDDADNILSDLISAYSKSEKQYGPCAILVQSTKGEGVSFMEEEASGWHGNPLTDEQYAKAMKELGLNPKTFRIPTSDKNPQDSHNTSTSIVVTDDKRAKAIASLKERGYGLTEAPTRKANEILADLGDNISTDNNDNYYKGLVVLIPDIGKSVVMDKFAKAHPQRFFDVGIKEMEATLEAMGLSASGFLPVVSTFDGFTYLPFSAIRMADYGELSMGFIFTHAEFIGEDGPSHLMTENLGAWLGLHNISTIANPADITQAKEIIRQCVDDEGMFYIRLGRPNVPVLYPNASLLPNYGNADVFFKCPNQHRAIITTGQEVWESMIAAEMLKEDGFPVNVVNVAYLKPFDSITICEESAGRNIFVVEAHKPETGLASLVSMALTRENLSIRSFNTIGIDGYVPSGTIEEQKRHCGLSGAQIYQRIREQIRK